MVNVSIALIGLYWNPAQWRVLSFSWVPMWDVNTAPPLLLCTEPGRGRLGEAKQDAPKHMKPVASRFGINSFQIIYLGWMKVGSKRCN